jgi:hypothetical protein
VKDAIASLTVLYETSIAGELKQAQAREIFYKRLPLLHSFYPLLSRQDLQLHGFNAGIPRNPLLSGEDPRRLK